jgi:hypothetical protein
MKSAKRTSTIPKAAVHHVSVPAAKLSRNPASFGKAARNNRTGGVLRLLITP